MQSLKNLHFAPVPKNSFDPILNKRNKLITRLQDQKALLDNPLHCSIAHRWEITADGRKNLVERKRKVRPWWRQDITGKFHLLVRYGQKLIEFEKGKPAIIASSEEELPKIIDTIIIAIQSGELDDALAAVSKIRPMKKKGTTIQAAA